METEKCANANASYSQEALEAIAYLNEIPRGDLFGNLKRLSEISEVIEVLFQNALSHTPPKKKPHRLVCSLICVRCTIDVEITNKIYVHEETFKKAKAIWSWCEGNTLPNPINLSKYSGKDLS
jgi:hypothetical protein